MRSLYAIHVSLAGKLCVVVGAGRVAERRVPPLLEAGASVRVVGASVSAGIEALAASGKIELLKSAYTASHLQGASLAFAATDSTEVNRRVLSDAAAHGILANNAEAADTGDFVVPASRRSGSILVSVSTNGSPNLAAQVADEIAEWLPADYADYAALLARIRALLRETCSDGDMRRAAMASVMAEAPRIRSVLAANQREAAWTMACDAAGIKPCIARLQLPAAEVE